MLTWSRRGGKTAHKKELALERKRLETRDRLRNKQLGRQREHLEDDTRVIQLDDSRKKEDDEKGECCICKETLTDPVFTPCGHLFDADCLRRWMSFGPRRNCPICRHSWQSWLPSSHSLHGRRPL